MRAGTIKSGHSSALFHRKELNMEKGYEMFITDLRRLLLAAMDMEEEKIYFAKKGEKYGCTGDRLFVECGDIEKSRQICGLHTEELYERYCKEHKLENIIHDCVCEIKKARENCVICDIEQLENYEKVKGKLFIRLLNADKNRDVLKDTIHHKVGDIALVLYYMAGEKDGYILSTKVKKHFLEQWEKDPDIVFEAALVNTYFISPPRIYHWEKMLFDKEYRGDNFMDILGSYHPNKGILGNCLSTEKRTNGAAAIFLPGVARRLAELLESDLYLVFTSIHEVMVHSTDKVYPEELKEVLLDTVKKATPEEDYLTSSIYRYSRRTGEFSVEVK